MQDVERQFADRNPLAFFEPARAVRREYSPHASDAETRAACHDIVEQELVGDVRAHDLPP